MWGKKERVELREKGREKEEKEGEKEREEKGWWEAPLVYSPPPSYNLLI